MTKKIRPQSKRGTKAKRGDGEIRRAAERAGIEGREPKDPNVYQRLLRQLRHEVVESFGMNIVDGEPTPPEIIAAAVSAGCDELALLQEIIEARDSTDMLVYFVENIRRRLDLARQLGKGLFHPDYPYVLASATIRHPRGLDAGMRAGASQSKALTPRGAEGGAR